MIGKELSNAELAKWELDFDPERWGYRSYLIGLLMLKFAEDVETGVFIKRDEARKNDSRFWNDDNQPTPSVIDEAVAYGDAAVSISRDIPDTVIYNLANDIMAAPPTKWEAKLRRIMNCAMEHAAIQLDRENHPDWIKSE